jgi:hypothetical protein
VQTLGAAVKPLGVQHQIHLVGARALAKLERLCQNRAKRFGILAPAFEAGPVPGGERGHLVEKKQLGVIAAPDVALAVLEVEHAADPLPRRPAALGQLRSSVVEAPAAIAHEQAARAGREPFAEWIDAILQWQFTLRRHAPRKRGIQ